MRYAMRVRQSVALVVLATTASLMAANLTTAWAQTSKPGDLQSPDTPPQSRPDPARPDAAPKGAQPAPQKKGEAGKGDPSKTDPSKGKAAEKKGPPPIAVQQPRTPAEREKALSDLYAHLATAENEAAAKTVAGNIERLWLNSGSDTVAVLMERAMGAAQNKKPDLAVRMLDAVVELAPDFAEGWNRRAYVHFSENRFEHAIGDLRRVLALDPNHFKALDGLAHILKDIGQKRGALAATRKLLEVHPFAEGAKAMHDELAREVEGQAL